jgi:hypothetical protein
MLSRLGDGKRKTSLLSTYNFSLSLMELRKTKKISVRIAGSPASRYEIGPGFGSLPYLLAAGKCRGYTVLSD